MIIETYTRVFVDADQLDDTIAFYTSILGGRATLRFADPKTGLELAAVSSQPLSVLIIAGPAERRAYFEATRLTIRVDRLAPYVSILAAAGSEQLDSLEKTPVGHKTRFRHPDGLIVEYVENDAAGKA